MGPVLVDPYVIKLSPVIKHSMGLCGTASLTSDYVTDYVTGTHLCGTNENL